LTALYGDERARGTFRDAPVVIAAYSGGYYPAAFTLQRGQLDERLRGLILLDALYSDLDKFAGWLEKRPPAFFVSAFGPSTREYNTALQRMLTDRGMRIHNELPANLTRGSVAFINAGNEVKHVDFVTAAWVADPLKAVLRRIVGFPRTGPMATRAVLKPSKANN